MAITIEGSGITSANIADGTIVDADVSGIAASKLTGALPAISGASLTNLPGIIIRDNVSAEANYSTTSNTWVDTALSITLTPASANSYFYVEMFHVNHINRNTPNYGGASRLLGGATEIARGGEFIHQVAASNLDYNGDQVSYGSFYNPSTAAAITFKAQVVSKAGGTEVYYWHWGLQIYINGSNATAKIRVTEFT